MITSELMEKLLLDGILKEHNIIPYLNTVEMLKNSDRAAIIHATGVGKTFVALQLIRDNFDKKSIYLVPRVAIGNQLLKYIESLPLETRKYFKNMEIMTYQKLINLSTDEIRNLDVDYLITDEFHHILAKVWYSRISLLKESHPKLKVFGMSATPVSGRGTSNEKDVADEFFEGNIASYYPLDKAIADGVLQAPIYRGAVYKLEEKIEDTIKKIKRSKISDNEKYNYLKKLEEAKRKVTTVDSFHTILKNNLKPNGKYIVFCPRSELQEFMDDSVSWFDGIALEENIVRYYMTSDESNLARKNEKLFYEDKDETKLRLMFVMDMYSEGVHVPDLDGVIMLRPSKSDIVFYQQLGRAMASGGSDKKTLVLDLVNNYDYVRRLKRKVKSDIEFDPMLYADAKKRDLDIEFDIDILNVDILEVLEEIEKKIYITHSEKMVEIIELLNSGYVPVSRDRDTVFSNGEFVANFWFSYKEKILEELQNNEKYKVGYEVANRTVFNLFFDKFSDFIELLNKGYIPKGTDLETKFSNGEAINYFWGNNKDKILDMLSNDPKYSEGYETAWICANSSYDNKLAEFIELLNTGYIPRQNEYERKFANGQLIKSFWSRNQKKIIELLENNPKYAEGYEVAKKVVSDKFFDKIEDYIEILNTGYVPVSRELSRKFSNGDLINYFWQDKKQDIIDKLYNDPKYSRGYEVAKEMVYKKTHPIDKISEYIMILNTGYIPKFVDKSVKFSNGEVVGSFWNNKQQEIVLELSNNPKYSVGYEVAKENAFKKFNSTRRKEKKYKKIDKVAEFIELLNTGYVPKTKDSAICFSNGEPINFFWSSGREKILERLYNSSEYAEGYEVAKKMVKVKLFDKVAEFIELLNTGYVPKNVDKERKFSNGDTINHFWANSKKNVLKRLDSDPKYKEGYDVAREVINDKGIDKIAEFIELLNTGYVPWAYDPSIKFSNGEAINYFWSANDNAEKIIQLLENDSRYSEGYETARRVIRDKKIDKVAEFIELLNTGYVPRSYEDDTNIKFSNGDAVCTFWALHKKKIIDRFNMEEKYKEGYEVARQIINNKHINKKIEYIEFLNAGYIPRNRDEITKFSNGDAVNNFWGANKNSEKIEKMLNTDPKYAEGYELAKRIVEIMKLSKKEQVIAFKELQEEYDVEFKSRRGAR